MKIIYLLLFGFTFLMPKISFSQEVAPLKNVRFSIDINQLKTEKQVKTILSEMNELNGVKDCELILTNYLLEFSCTNHDLKEHSIIEKMKTILDNENVSIQLINRKTMNNEH